MNSASENKESAPKLAPPGAGLPFFEWLIARYVLFPRAVSSLTWESADTLFARESEKILDIVKPLAPQERDTPVLIKRLRGLEDSSRNWSASMTLEHLMIVGHSIREILPALIAGKRIDRVASTAAVKPTSGAKPAIIEDFSRFVAQYLDDRSKLPKVSSAGTTFNHPWFGPMTAFQWHCLAAVHQRLHRGQIQAIVKRLPVLP